MNDLYKVELLLSKHKDDIIRIQKGQICIKDTIISTGNARFEALNNEYTKLNQAYTEQVDLNIHIKKQRKVEIILTAIATATLVIFLLK